MFRRSSFGSNKDFASRKKSGCARRRKNVFVKRKKLND